MRKQVIDCGTTVLCDLCNKEWTEDMTEGGGFLFGSKAVCPDCAPRLRRDAVKYGELEYLRDQQQLSETFYSFVQRLRGGKPGQITITSW